MRILRLVGLLCRWCMWLRLYEPKLGPNRCVNSLQRSGTNRSTRQSLRLAWVFFKWEPALVFRAETIFEEYLPWDRAVQSAPFFSLEVISPSAMKRRTGSWWSGLNNKSQAICSLHPVLDFRVIVRHQIEIVGVKTEKNHRDVHQDEHWNRWAG